MNSPSFLRVRQSSKSLDTKAAGHGYKRRKSILLVVFGFVLGAFCQSFLSNFVNTFSPLGERNQLKKLPSTVGAVDKTESSGVISSVEDSNTDTEVTTEFDVDDFVDTPILNKANLSSYSEWEVELYGRLDRIRSICGDLCRINTVEELERRKTVLSKDAIFPTVVTSNFQCSKILASVDIDAGDMTFPQIPAPLEPYFTLHGTYRIRKDSIRKDAYLGGKSETKLWKTGDIWTEEDIEAAILEVERGEHKGSYGVDEANEVRDGLATIGMKGKSVLVIGSSHPWIEVICLYNGARLVTTLEYGTINSQHPQIVTETPETFRQKYVEGAYDLEPFDGVVTHSSLEHSGLGRYGDALNPWGDILALTRAWCVTKPGGFLWLGLPTGIDFIFSNWHRVYGRIRWPLMTVNWKQVGKREWMEYNEDEILRYGPIKSMKNQGYIFERMNETEIKRLESLL